MPRREMVILYYEAKRFRVVPGRTGKFVTMEKPGAYDKVFVGKNGSLAIGRNISSATFHSFNFDNLRKWVSWYLTKAKEKQGGKKT